MDKGWPGYLGSCICKAEKKQPLSHSEITFGTMSHHKKDGFNTERGAGKTYRVDWGLSRRSQSKSRNNLGGEDINEKDDSLLNGLLFRAVFQRIRTC